MSDEVQDLVDRCVTELRSVRPDMGATASDLPMKIKAIISGLAWETDKGLLRGRTSRESRARSHQAPPRADGGRGVSGTCGWCLRRLAEAADLETVPEGEDGGLCWKEWHDGECDQAPDDWRVAAIDSIRRTERAEALAQQMTDERDAALHRVYMLEKVIELDPLVQRAEAAEARVENLRAGLDRVVAVLDEDKTDRVRLATADHAARTAIRRDDEMRRGS